MNFKIQDQSYQQEIKTKMQRLFFVLMAFLMINAVVCQPCGTYDPQDRVQSGLYEVQQLGSTTRRHIYEISLTNYVVPTSQFEVALSAQSIENYNPVNGFDFSLSGGRKANAKTMVITLFIDDDSSWKSMKVSYFASSNHIFITGFYLVDPFTSSNGAGNPLNFSRSDFPIPQWKLQVQNTYSAKVFISGVRVQGNKFNIDIINSAVDLIDSRIIVQFQTQAESSIELIQFSYIIYPTNHNVFRFNTANSTYEITGLDSIKGGAFYSQKLTICRDGGIPCKENEIFEAGRCVCIQGYSRNQFGFCVLTAVCGRNQQFDVLRNLCLCANGYYRNRNQICVPTNCGPNSFFNRAYEFCQCNPGFVLIGAGCFPVLKCPSRAVFNSEISACQCTQANQYIVRGQCVSCGSRQTWSGTSCVCDGTLKLIDGQCKSCHANSIYDGNSCKCTAGYYGDGLTCNRCHNSCSRCNGPSSNQCTLCAQVTYIFKNGTCTPPGRNQCPIGTFLNQFSRCEQCDNYCSQCTGKNQCFRCAYGFDLVTQVIFSQSIPYCLSICGDGKKNDQQQCDDNNTRSGDGCSSNCEIEEGFYCTTPSSLLPSKCQVYVPGEAYIVLRGAVRTLQGVSHSIYLSYIPEYFRRTGCVECSEILDIRVSQNIGIPIKIVQSYTPNTQGQFYVQFIFGQLLSSYFTFTVQLNQKFAAYFQKEEMGRIIERTVDPANLIKYEKKSISI